MKPRSIDPNLRGFVSPCPASLQLGPLSEPIAELESPAPQTPPPSPVPAPEATAAPPPVQARARAEEPASAQVRSRNPAVASGQPLLLFIVSALALAGAAIVVYTYRPGRSSSTRWKPAGWQSRRPGLPTTASESLGTLRPADGTAAIPLLRRLLTSVEGLIVGRAASICHVELCDPAVSRRHVRLRLVDETIIVEDLNSAGGSRIDGTVLQPFKPQPIVSGQTLNIADRVYRINVA